MSGLVLLSQFSFKSILKLAVILLCLLAVGSYYPEDPGLFHLNSPQVEINNWVGIFGSYFSDIVLNIFGYYVYFVLFSYLIYIVRYELLSIKTKEHRTDSIRIVALMTAATTSLLALYFPTSVLCPNGPGGILGAWLGWHMLHALGHVGVWVLCGLTLLNAYFHFNKPLDQIVLERVNASKSNVQQPERQPEILKKEHKKYTKLLDQLLSSSSLPQAKPSASDDIKVKNFSQKIPAKKYPTIPEIDEFDAKKVTHSVPVSLLHKPKNTAQPQLGVSEYAHLKTLVEEKLDDYGIAAEVVDIVRGPVITRLEVNLAAGTKASRLTSLSRDIARSMSVPSIRVVEVIPGKSCVGLELPNQARQTVYLSELISSSYYEKSQSPLTLVLGKDIAGNAVAVDLMRMPHLLVAGTTGSGKSVGINTMLLSLLYKSSPEHLKLILIDPKMLELAIYGDIPHLLTPVVTDMNDAAAALTWAVGEMERRYQIMAAVGVRNIQGYNLKVQEVLAKGETLRSVSISEEYGEILENVALTPFPYLVIVADEFADMIMVVGKKVEQLIARLAQKARAAGIHLILATQRPSVDVITGLIKANIPTRIAFQVSSKIDSRTILDQQGAEALLGSGDMLYLPPGTALPIRVHGAFVSDNEVHQVVNFLKKQGKPDYIDFSNSGLDAAAEAFSANNSDKDVLLDEAIIFVKQAKRVSISSIQRRFRIGYNRAATLVEAMEEIGVVTPPDEQGLRRISQHTSQ